jgi:hypothetical protein
MSNPQQNPPGWLKRLTDFFNPLVIPRPNGSSVLLKELQDAQKEWGYTRQYFNIVTEPDLIDLAIYSMSVAEKKYLYLLKKARETGLHIERYSYR